MRFTIAPRSTFVSESRYGEIVPRGWWLTMCARAYVTLYYCPRM